MTDTALVPAPTLTEAEILAAERVVEDGLVIMREQYYLVGSTLERLHAAQAWTAFKTKDDKPIYANWEDYVGRRFKVCGSYASRLRSAAGVYAKLPDGLKPLNESQARVLADLDDAAKITAMQQAYELAHGGRVTAELIRLVIRAGDAVVQEALASQGSVSVDGESVPVQAALTQGLLEQLNKELDTASQRAGYIARTFVGMAESPFSQAKANILKLLEDLENDPRIESGTLLHVRAYIPKVE